MREDSVFRVHGTRHSRGGVALASAAALLTLIGPPAWAHGEAASDSGFEEAYLGDFKRVSQKIVDLAEAMPATTYDWRPASGVRSVSENYMHIANANFFFASQLGVERPEDLPGDLEEVTDKAEVVRVLARSMDQLREMVEQNAGENLDGRQIDLFGNKMTARTLYFIAIGHLHEHLGLAIAYARSNGVVPPWSRPQASEGDG